MGTPTLRRMAISRRHHAVTFVAFFAPRRRDTRRTRVFCRRAFTLVELMAVVTIIGLIVGLATPKMDDILNRAKITRAIGDLRALSTELTTASTLPATLAGIGRAGMLDRHAASPST